MSDAFAQLNDSDQKAAVDSAIATIVLGLRIASINQKFYDFIATEFASSRSLPQNTTKYALRELGQVLLKEDWVLYVQKSGEQVTTEFTPVRKSKNGGEDLT